jgi:hypothetical protein
MNLVNILDLLIEKKQRKEKEFGKGKNVSNPIKSRAKTYPSISKALGVANYGDIFTTTAANRLYVVTKGKWGAKSGKGKVAKGFTPGSSTPSADFPSIKKHAVRTRLRYNPSNASKTLAKKYGSRNLKKKFGVK